MLIDDDEPTNFLSSMIIEEADCAGFIQVADSGEKAIEYLLNSQKFAYNNPDYPWPNLIFLDINMPAMNGWEFLERYKNLKKKQGDHIIVIMLTTSLNPDDRSKANSTGTVTDFMHKPLTAEVVNNVLQKYFVDCVDASQLQLNAESV